MSQLSPVFFFCLFVVISYGRGEERVWTDTSGRRINGSVKAFDGQTATVVVSGREYQIPISRLIESDRQFLQDWKDQDPSAANDPGDATPDSWPDKVVISRDLQVEHIPGKGGGGTFVYQTPNYEFISTVELSDTVTNELGLMFETTWKLLESCPINIRLKDSGAEKFKVFLYESLNEKNAVGDVGKDPVAVRRGNIYGTLPGLGARQTGRRWLFSGTLDAELCILRICQQRWDRVRLPSWASMGGGKYFGLLRYTKGNFVLTTHLKEIEKWAKGYGGSPVYMYPLEKLMNLSPNGGWNRLNAQQGRTNHYPTSVLLFHYFYHLDGEGDGKHIRDYMNAIKGGMNEKDAMTQHLLRDRSYEDLEEDFRKAFAKEGVRLTFRL